MISAPDAPLFLVLPLPAGEALFPFAPPPVFGAFLPELSSPKISSASAAAFAAAAFSAAAFAAAAFLSAAAFSAAAFLSAAAFSAAAFSAAFLFPWPPQQRRQWHLTPVFLPGKVQGQRSWQAAVHGVTRLSMHA